MPVPHDCRDGFYQAAGDTRAPTSTGGRSASVRLRELTELDVGLRLIVAPASG